MAPESNLEPRPGWADAMAFASPPGQPPVPRGGFFDLTLAHLTAAPPWVTEMDDIIQQVTSFTKTLVAPGWTKILIKLTEIASEKTNIILGLQNPPDDPDWNRLRELGIRITTLAYDKANKYGGGFLAPDAPLTDEGEELLNSLADAGMILDLSHSGYRTAREALNHIKNERLVLPVMASHIGCHPVYEHLRDLPDDVLRRIAETGGVVGIFTLTFGLDPVSNDLEPLWAHLQHALKICDPEAVAIGGDGAYCYQPPAAAAEQFRTMKERLDPTGEMGARFPDQPSVLNSSYRMHVINEFLETRLNDEARKRVMGANLINFFQKVL